MVLLMLGFMLTLFGCKQNTDVLCADYACSDFVAVVRLNGPEEVSGGGCSYQKWTYNYNEIEIIKSSEEELPEFVFLNSKGSNIFNLFKKDQPKDDEIYIVYMTLFNGKYEPNFSYQLKDYDESATFDSQRDEYEDNLRGWLPEEE